MPKTKARGGQSRIHYRISTPKFAILSARALSAVAGLLLVALALVPWQQTSFGIGKIVAYSPVEREQHIRAPISGQIATWYVQEGSHVEKGDLIAELADNDPNMLVRLKQEREAKEQKKSATSISIEAIATQIEAMKSTRKLSIRAAKAHVRMARNKVKAAKQKLVAMEAALKAARLNDTRQKELIETGLTSVRSVELAEMSRAKAEAAMFSARADVAAAEGDLLAKKADQERKRADADAKIAKEQAALQKARGDQAEASAALVQANVKVARQERQTLRATRNGTIARVLIKPGSEFVKAGEELALLVPDTAKRAAAIFIDGNDVPLIRPGQTVRLQFEGWPAVQFSGWPAVAVGTFGGKVSFVDATAEADGKFRVIIEADDSGWPKAPYLRQGVQANAWILLQRVTLGYEFWRKINGFPPRASAPKTKSRAKSTRSVKKKG